MLPRPALARRVRDLRCVLAPRRTWSASCRHLAVAEAVRVERSGLPETSREYVEFSPVNVGTGRKKRSSTQGQFKTFKPITPGIRHLRQPLNDHLHKGKPVRALTMARRRHGGRNRAGELCQRFVGGGHKQRIRTVDFLRMTPGRQEVVRIEYDPGRSAHIALLKHETTGELSYILAPGGLMPGQHVESFRHISEEARRRARAKKIEAALVSTDEAPDNEAGPSAPLIDSGILRTQTIKVGNCLPIRMIPVGTIVHAIGLKPGGRLQLVRSAGTFAQIVSHPPNAGDLTITGAQEAGYTQIRLASGEIRRVPCEAGAVVGQVSNPDHQHRNLGKAGRKRWLGIKPHVRGVAMNAVDHPHGGGRGKSKGNKHPVSKWGVGAKGTKTRKPGSKGSNKYLVKARPPGTHR